MKQIRIILLFALLLLALISCDQAEVPDIPEETTEQIQQVPSTPPSAPPTEEQTEQTTQEQTTEHIHTAVTDPAVAATCKQTGLTRGSHCSTCGQILQAQEIVPKSDQHKPATRPGKNATCEREGLTSGSYCTVCQITLQEQTAIPKLEHSPVTDPGKPASCTGTGLSDGSHCGKCGTVIISQTEIPPLAHEYGQEEICIVCKYPAISSGLDFELVADSYYLVSGLGSCTDTDIIIPVMYQGLPVKGLRYNAFENCTSITSVSMYESATIIGDYAFSGCTSLQSVKLSPEMTTLQKGVFKDCRQLLEIDVSGVRTFKTGCFSGSYFTEVTIPDHAHIEGSIFSDSYVQSVTLGASVTQLPYNTFRNAAKLTRVCLPDGMTGIGNSAFYGCVSLESITFPSTLKRIEQHAFSGCEKLANIDFSGASTQFFTDTFAGCNVTLIKNWTALPDKALFDYLLYEGVQSAQGMVYGQGYLLCCDQAFSGPLTVPEGIHTINQNAFKGCSGVTQILLPDSLTTIETGAFANCSRLERLTLPEQVTYVGKNALQNCTALTYVYLPDSLQNVGELAIPTAQRITICTGASATTLSNALIDNVKGMHVIQFRGTMQEWGAYYTSLNTTVFDYATIQCTDGDVIQEVFSQDIYSSNGTFTFTLTSDGTGTFKGQGMLPYYSIFNACLYTGRTSSDRVTKIVLAEGITGIQTNTHGESGFRGCTEIAEIVFPSTLTAIDKELFDTCAWYETFNASTDAIYIGDVLCMVPSSLTGTFVVRDGTVTIGTAAFADCKALTEIILPQSVQTIKNGAFSGCQSLCTIALPESIHTIEGSAFQGCHALRELTIPANMTLLRSPVVQCDGLKTLIISDSAACTYIGGFASYCASLETVVLGMGITELPANTLYECPNLKYVIIKDAVTSLDYSAFWNTPNGRKFLCYSAQTAVLLEERHPGSTYLYAEQAPDEPGNYWRYTENGEIELY